MALSLVVFGFIGFFVATNPFDKSPVNLLLAAAILVLGLGPLASWLYRPGRNPIPVLGLHGLFYALCFGVAGFLTLAPSRLDVSEQEYARTLATTLLSLLCTYGGYSVGLRLPLPWLQSVSSRDDPQIHWCAVYIFYPSTIAVSQLVLRLGISAAYQTVATLHSFVLVWILYACWSGRLRARDNLLVFYFFLPLDFLFYSGLAGGYLAGFLIYGQVLGLTYAATKKRIPLVPIVFAALLVVILQPAKMEYRRISWTDRQLSTVEGVKLYLELGLDQFLGHLHGEASRPYSESLLESYSRIDHLRLTAAVIADTPSVQPFRGGETYLPLFTKWIPRVWWPDKPREDVGQGWAHDYGYLDATDDVTSLNLPWLPEMYINFGTAGVVIISVLIGMLMAALWKMVAQGAYTPVHFAAGLVLCSFFFFPESNLSLSIGGLIIGGVVLWALLLLLSAVLPAHTLQTTSSSQRLPLIPSRAIGHRADPRA